MQSSFIMSFILHIYIILQENHKLALPYELQREVDVRQELPVIPESKEYLDELDFEDQVKRYHDEFNQTLLDFLKEIVNQQQNHFCGNILHILNRSVLIKRVEC